MRIIQIEGDFQISGKCRRFNGLFQISLIFGAGGVSVFGRLILAILD